MKAPNVVLALKYYYEKTELSSQDIMDLFEAKKSFATKMKGKARETMGDNVVPTFDPKNVNTEAAFEAWGIDVDKLEKSYKKLKKLDFLNE